MAAMWPGGPAAGAADERAAAQVILQSVRSFGAIARLCRNSTWAHHRSMLAPEDQPIHVTIPGCADDPRAPSAAPPGVVIHRVPPLHPDDVTTLPSGLPITSVARTLVDLAEELSREELRSAFARARELGILDIEAVRASAARVEWRPSLGMLSSVIAEFE
jgi:hypothetical protein